MRPLIRQPKLNKTERQYGSYLRGLYQAGRILDYSFEPLKLKLADNTFYTPDYLVVFPDRFEFHEVKGFWRDDARVKIKVAARLFPWFRFIAIKLVNQQWEIEEI